MAIDAPISVRASEQTRRDDAREAAAQYLATRAEYRRAARVEEAKESSAQRPTITDRARDNAAETDQRPRSRPTNGTGRLVDIVA